LVLDIKDLLDEAGQRVEKSSQDSKAHVNAARLDFELLSPFIQKIALKEDQKIRMQIIDSLEALGTKSLYSSERDKVNPDKVKRLWTEIAASLSLIFPQKGP
jgi:hypothetical protein